jgi:hypothetical protein
MTKKEEEIQRRVAEALALIVTSGPGRDDFAKAEADYYERLAESL